MNVNPWHEQVYYYHQWLLKSSVPIANRWGRRIDGKDGEAAQEAALGEALVWTYLENRSTAIHLNEDEATGGPDFRIETGYGDVVVEVTTMTTPVVTETTGLIPGHRGPTGYSSLTGLVRQEVKDKAKQLRNSPDAGTMPHVVFVALMHPDASSTCVRRHHIEELLTSRVSFTSDFNLLSGESSGETYMSTDLKDSLFLRAPGLVDASGDLIVEPVRKEVSAVMVGGFGSFKPSVFGVLHHGPNFPLDPRAFVDVPFCRLKHAAAVHGDRLSNVEWVEPVAG